ncbi:hypothetical protein [Zavarzinella formosa]|uniref:hypothetical protein n=1 Tax=Zavarzinella formosa TaxID=360055 RepID=UPI0003138DE4|nr:hypothetical protein [Zavarzinella formosa]
MASPKIQPPASRRLKLSGQLLAGLFVAVGVALAIYAGLVYGMIIGLQKGAEGANEPKPGVGMAPDLTGPIKMFFDTGIGGIIGAGLGLLLGSLLMWVFCRFLLIPLFRKVDFLSADVSSEQMDQATSSVIK